MSVQQEVIVVNLIIVIALVATWDLNASLLHALDEMNQTPKYVTLTEHATL